MRSIADQLPAEIAMQIHPDRRKNEAEYWTMRDRLLAQYSNQWIGFADGAVVAAGTSPVAVQHEAEATGLHPFVICVGREDQPSRIRYVAFPYDVAYSGEPLPLLDVEFRKSTGMLGLPLDRVIPDTGADTSVLPWADCKLLQLDPSAGIQSLISGVSGSAAATLSFSVWVYLDGQEYPCRLQADFVGDERILGRDVLNRLDIFFRGPAQQVVVNP